MNLINIKGLDKAKVLSGLYNASKEPYERWIQNLHSWRQEIHR